MALCWRGFKPHILFYVFPPLCFLLLIASYYSLLDSSTKEGPNNQLLLSLIPPKSDGLSPEAESIFHELSSLLQESSLLSIPCIPSLCYSTPVHFISNFSQLGNNGKAFVSLNSFPGSGNTMTRFIVEQGTRLFSGSVFFDPELFHNGFKGERISAYATNYPRVSVIKSHYPLYGLFPQKTNAVILIQRNPFHALLAEYTRLKGTGGADKHTSVLSLNTVSAFHKWCVMFAAKWRESTLFWTSKNFWNTDESHFQSKGGVDAYFLVHPRRQHVPVFLLFYEDLVLNLKESVNLLFAFLKVFLKDTMPSVTDSVACALAATEQLQREQRVHSTNSSVNPFLDFPPAVLEEICQEWKDVWMESKWGPCLLGPYRNNNKAVQNEAEVFRECE